MTIWILLLSLGITFMYLAYCNYRSYRQEHNKLTKVWKDFIEDWKSLWQNLSKINTR
jgi:hypothetical protein